MYLSIQSLFTKYARHALSLGLVFGLAWDALTINRPDTLFENVTMIGYLLLTAGVIVGLAVYTRSENDSAPFFPLVVLQFAFGNLVSALLVLFFKSGTLAGSFLFLLPFCGLLVANEFLHAQYMRVHVHVVVWYVCALVYAIFAIPIVTRSFGDASVLAGACVAILAVSALLITLFFVARARIAQEVPRIVRTICIVTFLFGSLYIARAIPPVPLLATHIGVYHSINRLHTGEYSVSYELPAWYSTWWYDTSRTFSYTPGTPLYCFSSIYAPIGITTPIYHRIESKQQDGQWHTVVHVPFDISGGRTLGFRGYSMTEQVTPGQWRCSVETARGAIIAQFPFFIVESNNPDIIFDTL